MLNKSFLEMAKVDISKYVKKRDGVEYLPWASCLYLLHQEGAENVEFYPVPGPDGHTLRKTDKAFTNKSGNANMCYEVVMHIKVDDKEWDVTYPVVNGTNSVLDNSMNQIRVHSACKRALVKGVAERLGLGFSLWMDEDDLPDDSNDLSRHSLLACRERLKELITSKINQGISLEIMADRLGMDADTLRSKFGLYNDLYRLEYQIGEMQP